MWRTLAEGPNRYLDLCPQSSHTLKLSLRHSRQTQTLWLNRLDGCSNTTQSSYVIWVSLVFIRERRRRFLFCFFFLYLIVYVDVLRTWDRCAIFDELHLTRRARGGQHAAGWGSQCWRKHHYLLAVVVNYELQKKKLVQVPRIKVLRSWWLYINFFWPRQQSCCSPSSGFLIATFWMLNTHSLVVEGVGLWRLKVCFPQSLFLWKIHLHWHDDTASWGRRAHQLVFVGFFTKST